MRQIKVNQDDWDRIKLAVSNALPDSPLSHLIYAIDQESFKDYLEDLRIHQMVMDKAKQIELTEEEVNDMAKKEGQE